MFPTKLLALVGARAPRSLWMMLAALGLSLFSVACGPPYKVVSQASPNPFLGATKFVVMPVDYTGLTVGSKSEQEYKDSKSDKQSDSFEGDKEGVNAEFTRELSAAAADAGISVHAAAGEINTFVIKPVVSSVEPGFYAYVASHPSRVTMSVKITGADGKELDEIIVEHQTSATMTNPSSGGRLRSDGKTLGKYVARYLEDRTQGAKK